MYAPVAGFAVVAEQAARGAALRRRRADSH
jgi:hypothetical protein